MLALKAAGKVSCLGNTEPSSHCSLLPQRWLKSGFSLERSRMKNEQEALCDPAVIGANFKG